MRAKFKFGPLATRGQFSSWLFVACMATIADVAAAVAMSDPPTNDRFTKQSVSLPRIQKDIWLFGGGEPLCSSVEPQFCAPDKQAEAEAYFQQTEAFRSKRFLLSTQGIATLEQFKRWPANVSKLDAVLQQIAKQQIGGLSTEPQAQFNEAAWYEFWKPLALSDDEQNLLDDVFELRQLKRDGSPKIMQLYFNGHQPYVQQMFKDFIEAARQHSQLPTTTRPKLLLITSSSNDPLQWVDYYLQHFNAAGADAMWLPIEPALVAQSADRDACLSLNQQRFIHNGQYNRAAHYPDLAAYQLALCQQPRRLEALINEADAIFINGGDQSLTMRSLQLPSGEFSRLGQLLLAKINQGTPLAGSSAGTAVQSGHSTRNIPMITGGRSGPAWRLGALSDQADSPLCYFHQRCTAKAAAGQLTYKADGGLGSFSLGVVDTHFRERNREGRLLRLLLDTNTAFGFGVDEATLLRAQFDSENSARLSVAGAGGVWIIDSRKATQNYSRKSAEITTVTSIVRVANLSATRLLAGDTASFSLQKQDDVGLNDVKLHCGEVAKPAKLRPDLAAYQEDAALIWQVGTTKQACQRADGRWRYTNLPLAVQAPTELNSQLR